MTSIDGAIFSIIPVDTSVLTGVGSGSGRLIRLMTDDELQLPTGAVLPDVAPAWRLLRLTFRKLRLPAFALLTLQLLALISLRLRLLATTVFLDSAPAVATDELVDERIDELTLDFLICSTKDQSQDIRCEHPQLTRYGPATCSPLDVH